MTDRRSPAWRLLILIIGAIALLGLVAAAACNDDDGGDDGSGDPAATMDDFDGGEGDDGNGDGGGDSLAELAAFGGDYDSYTGKVTYDITDFSTGDGAGLTGVTSMTIYQKNGSSRLDISNSDDDIIFISTPDASYLCSGGSDCLKYAADDELAGAAVSIFSGLFSADSINRSIDDIPAGLDFDVTSETIAGLDATCFKATGDLDPGQAGDESSEFCFSDGGLLLRLAFEGADQSSIFEATSASEDVLDSDFDPPYPVIDLGDLGDIFQP
ncbi:MAG: hypothetical protein J4O00_09765 [Chloroflexi bacterium]|nr:hypothetical protein [Chloroflexota bacterium]